MVSPDPTLPTAAQNKILNSILCTDAILYSLAILWAAHNIYFYLIKQNKWRIPFLTAFYSLAVLIFCLRVTMAVNYFRYNRGTSFTKQPDIRGFLLGDLCDLCATYLKASLGFLQFASIMEIVIQIK